MKRFILLSVFVLLGASLTAGYSDSSVTKETPTYQVIQDNDLITPVQSASVDYEHSESFILVSPELGCPKTEIIRVVEKPSDGYFSLIRPPPSTVSKIRVKNLNLS